jgi:hypothetical protein
MRQVDMYSGYVSSKNGGIILHLSAKHISFRLIIELDVMGLDKTSEHTIAFRGGARNYILGGPSPISIISHNKM